MKAQIGSWIIFIIQDSSSCCYLSLKLSVLLAANMRKTGADCCHRLCLTLVIYLLTQIIMSVICAGDWSWWRWERICGDALMNFSLPCIQSFKHFGERELTTTSLLWSWGEGFPVREMKLFPFNTLSSHWLSDGAGSPIWASVEFPIHLTCKTLAVFPYV